MKKIYTLLYFFVLTIFANATIHQVMVANFSFTPATVNAVCGDTVAWVWQSGTHTTTSTSVPSCATSWNANLSSSSPAYAIVVPCAGTYSYQCTPHASSGMVGTIVVTCSNAVPSYSANYFSAAYPNPFVSKVTVEISDADMISIYNAIGEKLKSFSVSLGQVKIEIDTRDLNQGIYFYEVMKEGQIIETRKLIKQ